MPSERVRALLSGLQADASSVPSTGSVAKVSNADTSSGSVEKLAAALEFIADEDRSAGAPEPSLVTEKTASVTFADALRVRLRESHAAKVAEADKGKVAHEDGRAEAIIRRLLLVKQASRDAADEPAETGEEGDEVDPVENALSAVGTVATGDDEPVADGDTEEAGDEETDDTDEGGDKTASSDRMDLASILRQATEGSTADESASVEGAKIAGAGGMGGKAMSHDEAVSALKERLLARQRKEV